MDDLKCCTDSCLKPLDKDYWNGQYIAKNIGWDLGTISPALKAYIDTIENKELSVLIPGCGNAYEAEYLSSLGFTNVTLIDIAPSLVESLQNKFQNNPAIKIVLGDFFEHRGTYDLILEQTFFCALPPSKRPEYVQKMHTILSEGGKLAGLLFNRTFEQGPPFGGNVLEYQSLFQDNFEVLKMEICTNSIAPRANTEVFFEMIKLPIEAC